MTHLTRSLVLRMAVVGIVITVASSVTAGAQPPVNPRARALKEFGDRLQTYQALREKLASTLAPLPADAAPEQIRRHQAELAAAIRKARRRSQPGEIFTPPVVPQFRTVIRNDLRSRDVRDAVAALQEVPAMHLQVNGGWPAEAPRPTIPPGLLANLYPLPHGLEYRLVDRHLVLFDSEAGLIVDFVRGVVPSVVSRR